MYTGNALWQRSDSAWVTVYPCVYRERSYSCTRYFFYTGLSLCIQGTLIFYELIAYFFRFIPVYTGNAPFLGRLLNTNPVYPCVYRERVGSSFNIMIYHGLSLCIQGTPVERENEGSLCRFIPVYTGNALIITYCFIIKILTVKFLPIFWDIFH